MPSVPELRQRLKRPLELERSTNFQDTAVVGGLEKLLDTLGKPFADIRAVLDGYSTLSQAEREGKLVQAIALLDNADEKDAAKKKQRAKEQEERSRNSPYKAAKDAKKESASSSKKSSSTLTKTLKSDQLDEKLGSSLVPLGAQAPKKLLAIGIDSYRTLMHYYPKRYEDRRVLPYFAALTDEESVTVAGKVVSRKGMKSGKGLAILRVSLEDKYGAKLTAIWFNQPWLEKQIFPGQKLIATGKVKRRGKQLDLNVTHFEIDDDGPSLSSGRIVSIYGTTQGLSQAYIRKAIQTLLHSIETIPDHLPKKLLGQYDLVSLKQAVYGIHFPENEEELQKAIKRLKFDEFLFLELRILLNRDYDALGKVHKITKKEMATFTKTLPFEMTNAQKRTLDEILTDMKSPGQMARLLQGDVGSGKTAVAAAAIFVAVKNKRQAVLMAPTEILARQHFLNLQGYLYELGVRLELLVGSMTKKQADAARQKLKSGEADVAIGTQALIQDSVEFHDLGLAVIDEEHRFGVEQRRKLLANTPDVLVMSATPIPRSLALTYYGDLELSVIDELPPGRKAITTKLVNDGKRRDVYRFAWSEIKKGRQVYVVTPLIEESEAEVMAEIVSAEQTFEDLQVIMPDECRIELLHGKMAGSEKDDIMEDFRNHEFDLLVSTTVIEVGVDIPNASLMIIENAERFGLSQLHQLRGRVGRGEYESYCVLIAGDRSRKTQQRLEVIAKYTDGFIIAEKDLVLRGPGEIKGTRQSGMPDLVLGDLTKDGEIIENARDLAKKILEADPKMEANWIQGLREELKRRVDRVSIREII